MSTNENKKNSRKNGGGCKTKHQINTKINEQHQKQLKIQQAIVQKQKGRALQWPNLGERFPTQNPTMSKCNENNAKQNIKIMDNKNETLQISKIEHCTHTDSQMNNALKVATRKMYEKNGPSKIHKSKN